MTPIPECKIILVKHSLPYCFFKGRFCQDRFDLES